MNRIVSLLRDMHTSIKREWLEKPHKVVRKLVMLIVLIFAVTVSVARARQHNAVFDVLNEAATDDAEVYIIIEPFSETPGRKAIMDSLLRTQLLNVLQPNDTDWGRERRVYDIFMDLQVVFGENVVDVNIAKDFEVNIAHVDARVRGFIGFPETYQVEDLDHVVDQVARMLSESQDTNR